MLGDMPETSPAQSELLTQLSEHWSVTGEAVLVSSAAGPRAVRPDYVYPVHNVYDRETIDGYLFVFPERKKEFEHTVLNQVSYAERARVIAYDAQTGQAYLSTREYRPGYVADTPLGTPIDIGQVHWINTRDGVYS